MVLGLGLGVFEALVDAGAELEARDEKLQATPLIWSVKMGREDMVRLLLQKGASPHARVSGGGGRGVRVSCGLLH
jgi:ankyrin repeat protein